MVAAILLHYVIDDPLPNRGTFGDPGSNSGADNFFLAFENVFLFFHMLSSFFHMLLLHRLLFYSVCTVASCKKITYQVVTYYILHITYYIPSSYILHITYYILHTK